MIPFSRSICNRIVFPFVIYSSFLASCRYFLSWWVNPSSIHVNFLKPESMNATIASCFPVLYFLIEIFFQSRSCSPSTLIQVCDFFFVLFIHSGFLLCSFCCHILLWNCSVFFTSFDKVRQNYQSILLLKHITHPLHLLLSSIWSLKTAATYNQAKKLRVIGRFIFYSHTTNIRLWWSTIIKLESLFSEHGIRIYLTSHEAT